MNLSKDILLALLGCNFMLVMGHFATLIRFSVKFDLISTITTPHALRDDKLQKHGLTL